MIFHGSVLRVIHAGGLLYLALILKILYEALHFLPQKTKNLIVLSIILNGFSVAGFGNTFLLLPFILLVSDNHQKIRGVTR